METTTISLATPFSFRRTASSTAVSYTHLDVYKRQHPQHELAKKQQSAFGAVVSFEVRGGRDAAWKVIDATRVISITTNLGDTKTTIAHPATTSHGRLTPQERANAGISDSLIRVAVGLEELQDLQADLARGLAAL